MPSLDATLAVQFDKATLGLTIAFMRKQILANIETLTIPHRPSLHNIHGLHPAPAPRYNVILSEHEITAMPLLHYQAAVICSDAEGIRVILHGKKEATIWAAYRDLMRITMREVGKRMSVGSPGSAASGAVGEREGQRGGMRMEMGHRRGGSGDSGVAGLESPTSVGGGAERSVLGGMGERAGFGGAEREAGKGAKSLRVLGLEGME
ncbi:hypothetical protein KVT40_003485 [Elsinoe batatas]|uniref:Uncharacterized protein n=1 Tax=Elsinoe batatas TaxID=2601811 RepID=A0A8K0L8W3_9PEZI|nr:hypothetical protein KVT40_003485 [Elsinoe batatas]